MSRSAYLETHKHPTEEVITAIVAKLPPVAEHLTLLVAPDHEHCRHDANRRAVGRNRACTNCTS